MGFILMLLVMAVPIFAVFYPLYLGGKIKYLEQRIDTLERAQSRTNSSVSPSKTMSAGAMSEPVSQIPLASPEAVVPPPMPQSYESAPSDLFMAWLREDFLVKLGAFLLLLAFGWVVSYAFMNNLIGEVGRIMLGLLGGLAIMCVGIWRITTHKHQGSIFVVLGSTIILLTTYAARDLYNMFTPLSALVLMFAAVVLVAFVSVRHNREQLAIAGLILGSIAPWFTAAPDPDLPTLFLYLLLVALGTLWVVSVTGWSKLTLISMVVVFLYSLPYLLLGVDEGEQDVAMMFSFIFVSLYFVANLISLVRRRGKEHIPIHVLTVTGVAAFLVLWVNVAVAPEWQSLVYVAWALAFSVGTYIVFLYTSNVAAFYIYSAASVGLIGAATAAELQGPALTIAFLLEISLLLVAVAQLGAPRQVLNRVALLFGIPVLLSFGSLFSSAWQDGLFHADFVVVTLTALILSLASVFLYSRTDQSGSDSMQKVLLVTGGVYIVFWVWLVCHALFTDPLATMIALFTYAVCGVTFFVLGTMKNQLAIRYIGVSLLLFVVGRLLLIDVWNMELVGRIITFFVIGVLLISTAFIKKSDAESAHKNSEL